MNNISDKTKDDKTATEEIVEIVEEILAKNGVKEADAETTVETLFSILAGSSAKK